MRVGEVVGLERERMIRVGLEDDKRGTALMYYTRCTIYGRGVGERGGSVGGGGRGEGVGEGKEGGKGGRGRGKEGEGEGGCYHER